MASGITNVGGNPGFNPALTATAGQVLVNRTFSVDGKVILTGTMPDRGAASYSMPINGSYNIAAGYHNGSGNVTQSITTKGAQTFTPSTTNQTISAGQYLSGVQTIAGSANLTAPNIKNGVNVFGVVGTYAGGVTCSQAGNAPVVISKTSSAVIGTTQLLLYTFTAVGISGSVYLWAEFYSRFGGDHNFTFLITLNGVNIYNPTNFIGDGSYYFYMQTPVNISVGDVIRVYGVSTRTVDAKKCELRANLVGAFT